MCGLLRAGQAQSALLLQVLQQNYHLISIPQRIGMVGSAPFRRQQRRGAALPEWG